MAKNSDKKQRGAAHTTLYWVKRLFASLQVRRSRPCTRQCTYFAARFVAWRSSGSFLRPEEKWYLPLVLFFQVRAFKDIKRAAQLGAGISAVADRAAIVVAAQFLGWYNSAFYHLLWLVPALWILESFKVVWQLYQSQLGSMMSAPAPAEKSKRK